jgi:hypothetical protein
MASKATVRQVDFSGVKDGGGNFNKSRIKAGDYLAIITKVVDAVAKDKTDQYLFSIKIKSHSTSIFPYYCKLQENQLWKLRNLFVAAGKTVPKKRVKVDPNQIVGKLIGVAVEDTEYEGKEQSQIAAVFPAAEIGDDESLSDDNSPMTDDDDEDDEEVSSGPRFSPSDDEDDEEEEADDEEEEDEAEDEAEDFSKLTRAELKDRIRALQPDFVVRKSMSDSDLADTLTDLTSDAGEADEEEEEPEPEPKKTRSSTAAKRKAAKAKVDDDDLDGLDIDDL